MDYLDVIRRQLKGSSKLLDFTSMGLSGLCVAHCLLLPLVISSLPFAGDWTRAEWVHQVLVCLAAPLTAWTLYRSGAWRKPIILSLAVLGIFLLGLAAFYSPAQTHEVAISVVGALCVATAHLINYLEHAYSHRRALPHACHQHN